MWSHKLEIAKIVTFNNHDHVKINTHIQKVEAIPNRILIFRYHVQKSEYYAT